MPENQTPDPTPNVPLDATLDATIDSTPTNDDAHGTVARPASTDKPADVTTDFDESDSAPSSQRLGLIGNAQRPSTTNQMVADYRLDGKLGEGGMGRVFKAIDQQGRAVAIKLLSQHLTCSDEALQRFKQEGIIASQINHPHCVFVHRVDDDRGMPYIAMELMTGKTLKDLVQKQGALPYKDAVRLILQCIDGLIEAHRLGMIHRDIKPANCYLDEEGNVKIGDFGLARSLVDDSELTRTGAFVGTPLFASPEQLLGQKIDERSDIYSLSATLYYLLAGRAPFESPNAAQVIAKIASSDPPSFKENNVGVPAALESIVMHGLARDRNKRFESFEKMRAALSPLVAPDLEIASLPRRFVAMFLDNCIFFVIVRMLLIPLTNLVGLPLTQLSTWMPYLTAVLWLLYLWLFEWLLGWTIGKRIVKLKVVDSQTGLRQKAISLLLRAIVFVAATESLRLLAIGLLSQGSFWLRLIGVVNWGMGATVCMWTWKRSGKRQLTHEAISQTETCMIVLQRKSLSAQLRLPDWSLPMNSSALYPTELGRFAIKGQLITQPSEQWLLAHDVNLDREVWIHWLPVGAPPISAERKGCTLRTRMRVIESGMEQNRHWDAFLAPEGVPLSVFIEHGGHVPWPTAHHWLSQLVAEGEQTENTKSSDAFWNVNRYWLDSAGRLTFAEVEVNPKETVSSTSLAEVMQQVAIAALPPKHRLRRAHRSSKSFQPSLGDIGCLPSYGGLQLLERLAQTNLSLPQLKNQLERVNQSAEQVTPSMRFVHAAVVTLLLTPFMLLILVLLVSNMIFNVDHRIRHTRYLAAISHIQQFPEKYPSAFEGLTADEKTQWLTSAKIELVQSQLLSKHEELRAFYQHSSSIERTFWNAMTINEATITGEMVPPELLEVDESARAASLSSDDGSSPVEDADEAELSLSGFLERSTPLAGLFSKVSKMDALWRPIRIADPFRTMQNQAILGGFSILILWTGLTRGGLGQLLTGVSVVRRDGCRIGIMRALLRSAILFGPFAALTWLVLELETEGAHWLWLSSQIKLILGVSPGLYLVGALIWPQIGLHDRLCKTVMVPR